MRSFSLLIAGVTVSLGLAARACAAEIDQSKAFKNATTAWTGLSGNLKQGRSVVVFEVGQAQTRHVCHVRELRPDSLVCSGHFRHDHSIPTQDISAVLEPRQNDDRTLQIWGATGGALILAGFFAGPAAPAFWVVGGLLLFTWPAAAMGADNGPEHDAVLYYAPGPQPTLPLR